MCAKPDLKKKHNIRQMTKLRETLKRNTMHALKPLQNAQLRIKIKKKTNQKTANIKKN